MSHTKHIETFSSYELQDLKKEAETENPIEAMKKWARRQYAIPYTNRHIADTKIKEGFTGEITIIER